MRGTRSTENKAHKRRRTLCKIHASQLHEILYCSLAFSSCNHCKKCVLFDTYKKLSFIILFLPFPWHLSWISFLRKTSIAPNLRHCLNSTSSTFKLSGEIFCLIGNGVLARKRPCLVALTPKRPKFSSHCCSRDI